MLNDLIDFNDLTLFEWETLLELGFDIYDNPLKYKDYCKNKILATLFYEPSTRTNFSFQSAMLRLGGNFIGFTGTSETSVSKGETLKDTVKIVSNYSDAIVIRHPSEGAAYAASLYTKLPVINAGDGGHLHPTQTMTDLFTIGKLKNKKMTGLDIGICGDLLYGRTVHSLLKAFSMYSGNTFYFISTEKLRVPEYFTYELSKNNKIIICDRIEDCIDKLDIIYMTRIQRERFKTNEEYQKQVGIYILDKEKLSKAKEDLIILHPLPKNNEIAVDIDDGDQRAQYFNQAGFGMYIRMALIIKLLEKPKTQITLKNIKTTEKKCVNENCVVNTEKNLPDIFKTVKSNKANSEKICCAYCETEM